MSRSTISTFELFQMFPDAESARAYFEGRGYQIGANGYGNLQIVDPDKYKIRKVETTEL